MWIQFYIYTLLGKRIVNRDFSTINKDATIYKLGHGADICRQFFTYFYECFCNLKDDLKMTFY